MADQPDASDEKGPTTRFRASLAVAVATLALIAAAEGVGLATSNAKPVLRTFSVSPSSLRSSGGGIHIKVTAAHATSCIIASSPGIKGLPKAVSCKSGVASLSLQVPSNKYAFTRRFRISARAVHLQVSSALSYRWLAQGGAARTPRVLDCLGHPVVKPANYILTCADANMFWTKVRWVSWGAKTALGKGQYVENDCIPDCAQGHFHAYPATVVMSHLTTTKKYGPLYAQVMVSYLVQGKYRSYTFPLAT